MKVPLAVIVVGIIIIGISAAARTEGRDLSHL